jgi:methionyl-tRNA synthetase
MTEKICKKCGNYEEKGKFCVNCGTQLYPDIGFTQWNIPDNLTVTMTTKPTFNAWTGKPLLQLIKTVDQDSHPKDGEIPT